jgi:opacity protein-like surface antigen
VRLCRLPAALALVMACAIPAQAQEQTEAPVQPGLWSVTPFLSFTFGGDSDTTSLGFGGALGYAFTDVLSVEGELGYVFDLVGDDEFADWSTLSLSGNVLYHFPLANGSTPYATAGIGFVREKLEFSDTVRDTLEFGVNVGGGIKTPITDKLSARGDIRYFKYTDAAPDGFRLYGGITWMLGR